MGKKNMHNKQDKNASCCSCEVCKTINADPANMEKNGGRLLTVKVKVKNVCYDKKVYVACIIYDKYDKILAFRGFSTILCKKHVCCKNTCGTIKRKLVFALPDDDMYDPDELDVRTMANYIYPCGEC